MKTLHYKIYRDKLKGCFIGKAIGGTLGMPYEGKVGIRPVDYYDPVPTGMTENDDLDLQVVWLETIRQKGLPVNRYDLAEGWKQHVRCVCDEYGTALRNLKQNILPPLSGDFDSKFHDGMGAAIRTEIWAGIAPGDPALAVRLATEDACVDHCGDGLYAAQFLAAVESAAYLESDPATLLAAGLSFLPKKCRLASGIRYAMSLCETSDEPLEIREKILSRYFVQNWTDVTLNLSLIVTAWLCGKGDSSRALCIAAELGQDADCTCATLGAILGILSPDGFDSRWTDPIGEDLVLSANIANMHEPMSIHTFCHRIAELCTDTLQYYHSQVALKDAPFFSKNYAGPFLSDPSDLPTAEPTGKQALLAVRPFIVTLTYPEQVALTPGVMEEFTLTVTDPTHRLKKCGLTLLPCDSMTVTQRNRILTFDEQHTASTALSVTIEAGRNRRAAANPLTFRFESEGLLFDCTAGIPTVYEFLRSRCEERPAFCPSPVMAADAVVDASAAHYRTVPAGGWLYSAEFRSPVPVADTLLAVTGTRAMAVWLDNNLIMEHDSLEYVPAFHRTENVLKFALDDKWHRLVVWVSPATAPDRPDAKQQQQTDDLPLRAQRYLYDKKNLIDQDEGELFIGFASRRDLQYLRDIEWRLPNQ